MKFKVFNSIDPLRAVWNSFDALAAQLRQEGRLRYIDYSFYQTYQWNEFFEKHIYSRFYLFIKRKRLDYVVVSDDDDNPVAILPLLISMWKRKIEFSSWKIAGINNVIYRPGTADKREISSEIVGFLTKNYIGYKYRLNDIPESSPFYESLSDLQGGASHTRSSYNLWISEFGDFDSYKKSLSKSLRQTLRTARNHMTGTDNWLFVTYNDTSELKTAYLYKIWRLYFVRRNEWKKRGKYGGRPWYIMMRSLQAISTDPMSKVLSSLDNARLCALEIDGIPVAFSIYFLFEDNLIVPRLAIDSRYRKLAPGLVLLENMIQWAFNNGIRNFELGRGDEPYKTRIGCEGTPIGQFTGSFKA